MVQKGLKFHFPSVSNIWSSKVSGKGGTLDIFQVVFDHMKYISYRYISPYIMDICSSANVCIAEIVPFPLLVIGNACFGDTVSAGHVSKLLCS